MTQHITTLKYDFPAIKQNLIDYFTKEGIGKEDDFDGLRLSREKINILFDKDQIEDYVSLKSIHKLAMKLTNIKDIWLLKIFMLIDVEYCNGYELIKTSTIKTSSQFIFSYAIYTFINNLYNDLEIITEDVFLQKPCFEKFTIGRNSGPRVDLIIDKVRLIIECDEKHHSAYTMTQNDKNRDILIKSMNYEVLRFSCKSDNIDKFLHRKLKPVLSERNYLFQLKIIDYIVDVMEERGHNKDNVLLMFDELCAEYISEPDKEIKGLVPKNLTLEVLCDILHVDIDDDEFLEVINNILPILEEKNYPYERIDNIIIFSPKAFDTIVLNLNSDDYPTISLIKDLFIDIKDLFTECLCKMANKHRERNETSDKSYCVIANNGYDRGIKDSYKKYEKIIKENEILKYENEILLHKYKSSLVHDGRGIKKKKIIPITDVLKKNMPIISELPNLVFTDDMSDTVEIEKIRVYYNINAISCSNMSKYDDVLNNIFTKLNLSRDNDICKNILYKCKFLI